MLRHSIIAAALIGGLAFGVPALAADSSRPNTVKGEGAGKSKHHSVEAHISQLRKKLRITEQQAPQWDAFAQVMRDNSAQFTQLAETRNAQQQSMNAVDDLRSFQAIAQAHADGLSRLQQAFQGVYDIMSPEQRKNADSVFHDHKRHFGHKGGA